MVKRSKKRSKTKKRFLKKWISGSFRTGSSGPLGGISGGRKFRPTGGSSGPSAKTTKSFWDPSLEGSRNFSPEVPPEISGGAEIPAYRPEVPARGNFGWKND